MDTYVHIISMPHISAFFTSLKATVKLTVTYILMCHRAAAFMHTISLHIYTHIHHINTRSYISIHIHTYTQLSRLKPMHKEQSWWSRLHIQSQGQAQLNDRS